MSGASNPAAVYRTPERQEQAAAYFDRRDRQAASVRQHERLKVDRETLRFIERIRTQVRVGPATYEAPSSSEAGRANRTVVSPNWTCACTCQAIARCWHSTVAADRERMAAGLSPFGFYGKSIESRHIVAELAALNERDKESFMSENNGAALVTRPHDNGAAIIEQVVVGGDLGKLSAADRVAYYRQVCDSLGLNPFTKPFNYLTLNNRLVLYATRDAADQLRRIHGVGIDRIDHKTETDIHIVTAYGHDKTGRSDAAVGAVNIAGLKGESRANAIMKAETKAKRRLTLSLVGLGWLDETETDSIADARPVQVDIDTGEIVEPPAAPPRPAPQASEATAPKAAPAAELSAMGIVLLDELTARWSKEGDQVKWLASQGQAIVGGRVQSTIASLDDTAIEALRRLLAEAEAQAAFTT